MAKHRVPRGSIILLVIVCMLLASLGGLGFYTATKVERMQGEITQLERALAKQKEENSGSSAEMDKLQAENDKLQAKNDQLETENADQKAENDQLKTENAEQQATIDKQQDTIDDLKV